MDEKHRESLSDYRLESAEEHLRASKLLLDSGLLKDSIGRSYYAMFAAARALLALDEVDFSKHAGVILCFQKEYIKTGRFDKEYIKMCFFVYELGKDNQDPSPWVKSLWGGSPGTAPPFCEFSQIS